MSDKATERAREIVARAWLRRLFPSGYAASDEAKELRAMIAEGFRQTERAVWLEAAEVVEQQAGYYPEDVFPADGTSTDAISAKALRVCLPAVAAALRRRAEEV